ncbi:MAG: hypothetical protein ACRERE_45535 [Candidatus Entotheonellia bacterium]
MCQHPGEPSPGRRRALHHLRREDLQRCQTVCDDGTQTVSRYNRALDCWVTSMTQATMTGPLAERA